MKRLAENPVFLVNDPGYASEATARKDRFSGNIRKIRKFLPD
jgi:hypothetical protein